MPTVAIGPCTYFGVGNGVGGGSLLYFLTAEIVKVKVLGKFLL